MHLLELRRFRPAVERLELREVPAATAVAPSVTATTALVAGTRSASTLTVNDRMVTFLNSKVGYRLGGGECAHVATEALRVGGGKFIRTAADYPSAGDYVWGTLVTKVEVAGGRRTDSNPSNRVKPGDIIQYRNATFNYGTYRSSASHHTAVVAAVNSAGRPTLVFEQNINLGGTKGQTRYVVKRAIDLTKMTGGWVRVYRPQARAVVAGRYEFTIVNNAASSKTFSVTIGTRTWTYTLTAANTLNSYKTLSFTSSGTVPKLTRPGGYITLVDGAGYQLKAATNTAGYIFSRL